MEGNKVMTRDNRKFVEWYMKQIGYKPHRSNKEIKTGCDSCKTYYKDGHTGYDGVGANCECDYWEFDWVIVKEFIQSPQSIKLRKSKLNSITQDMIWLGTKGH